MESSHPSAQRIHEELQYLSQLWKTNKLHFFIVLVLLLGAGYAVIAQSFTIPGLHDELKKRDADIVRLEQRILPFQTAAVQKFSELTEDEALSKLATRVGQVELGLMSIFHYQEVSTWGATGIMRKQVAAMTSFAASPVAGWNDGLWKITSSDGTEVSDVTGISCDTKAKTKYLATIERAPLYPFPYYSMAICLQNSGTSEWKVYMQKAYEVLSRTTQVPNHHADHDWLMGKITSQK